MVTCPYCAESIPEAARECPRCHSDLTQSRPSEAPVPARKSNTGLIVLIVAGSVLGLLVIVGLLLALLLPAILASRTDARSVNSQVNLKQIALGAYLFHDVQGTLPPPAEWSGSAVHSWQTALIPYLEHKPLYDSIDLDQPWDAPANRTPFSTRIPTFLLPGTDEAFDPRGYALGEYAGNVQVIRPEGGLTFEEITDGIEYTLLCGEVTAAPKPWGDPTNVRDPAAGLNGGANTFGGPWPEGGVNFAMVDGAVQFIDDEIDPRILKALADPNDGEEVDLP